MWRYGAAALWLTSLALTVPYRAVGTNKLLALALTLYFFSSGILRTPLEKRVLRPKIGNEQVSAPLNRTVGMPGADCRAL